MTSFLNATVYPQQNHVQIQQYDDVLIEPTQSPPPSSAVATVILALPNTSATTIPDDSPSPKIQHTEQMEEKTDSRKLFQRLWTEEDEIVILQGFLDYNANRESSSHNDSSSFFDQIKSKIQLDFNKSQLVDKLRRLKIKYRKNLQKFESGKDFIFRSPHEQSTFELSHKIWNTATPIEVPVEDDEEINPNPNPNSVYTTPVKNKRSRTVKCELDDSSALNKDDNYNNCTNNNSSSNVDDENGEKCNGSVMHNVPGLIEETVKNCLKPVLKEVLSNPFGFGGRGLSLNPVPFSFMNLGCGEKVMDENWRKQQILELEVYSKRLELVQDEIKVALEELRSSERGGGGKF